MRLFELTGEYRALRALAEDGADVSEALSALDGALADKATGCVHVLRELELSVEMVDAEIKRLTEKKRAVANNAARLREHVRAAMEAGGIERVKADTFTLSLQENPCKVEVIDESLVPTHFVRVKHEVSKSAILAHYKETGEVVPGTDVVRGTRLVIR